MGARRTALRNILDTFREELVDYKVYDKDGVFKRTDEINVLQVVPTDLRPLNQDLIVEYLRPAKKVILESKMKSNFTTSSNPTFKYGSFKYTIPIDSNSNPSSEVVQNSAALSDGFVARTLEFGFSTADIAGISVLPMIVSDFDSNIMRPTEDLKINLSYYVDNDNIPSSVSFNPDNPLDYYFTINVYLKSDETTPDRYQYNFRDNQWDEVTGDSAFVSNPELYSDKIKNSNNKKWNNYTNVLKMPENINSEFVKVNVTVNIPIYRNQASSDGHNNFFLDNFFIGSNYNPTNTKIISKRTSSSSSTITGFEIKRDLFLSNELADTLADNAVDGEFTRLINPTVHDTLEAHITQEIVNDYRSFVKRYEGSLYGFSPNAISLMNKLWINFGTELTEDYTAYIDSMKYNLKKNQYQVIAHLSNQDNDQSSDYSVSFE